MYWVTLAAAAPDPLAACADVACADRVLAAGRPAPLGDPAAPAPTPRALTADEAGRVEALERAVAAFPGADAAVRGRWLGWIAEVWASAGQPARAAEVAARAAEGSGPVDDGAVGVWLDALVALGDWGRLEQVAASLEGRTGIPADLQALGQAAARKRLSTPPLPDDGALADGWAALARRSNDPADWATAALYADRAGRAEDAVLHRRAALAVRDDPAEQSRLAADLAALGRWREAALAWERAAAGPGTATERADAAWNAGLAWEAVDELSAAAEAYGAALAAAPDDPGGAPIALHLGELLLWLDRPADAIPVLARVRFDPRSPEPWGGAHRAMALAFDRLDRPRSRAEAWEAMRRAPVVDPSPRWSALIAAVAADRARVDPAVDPAPALASLRAHAADPVAREAEAELCEAVATRTGEAAWRDCAVAAWQAVRDAPSPAPAGGPPIVPLAVRAARAHLARLAQP